MKQNNTGLDPKIVGRIYEGTTEAVIPEKTMAYAKATNETNPYYYETDEEKLRIPPLFPVTMTIASMKAFVTDESLNLNIFRMVHGEQEILYHRPLRVRDKIKTTVVLESIDVKESGDILWAKIIGKSKSKIVFEMKAGMFFKKIQKESKRLKSKEEKQHSERKVLVSKQMRVTPDQMIRYAAASNDENPIHLDRDFAIAAGLPGIILHGLCTLAFATQAIVDTIAGGDPRKVKRIKTRFSKPVLMKDILTTEGWLIEENEQIEVIGFETKNQKGKTVLKLGVVELLK